jgi:hypothetical protein
MYSPEFYKVVVDERIKQIRHEVATERSLRRDQSRRSFLGPAIRAFWGRIRARLHPETRTGASRMAGTDLRENSFGR